MELQKWVAYQENYTFLIQEEGINIGCYLFVWKNKTCIRDYLQGDQEICKQQALEEYEIPFDAWKKIPSDTRIDFKRPNKLRDIADRM